VEGLDTIAFYIDFLLVCIYASLLPLVSAVKRFLLAFQTILESFI